MSARRMHKEINRTLAGASARVRSKASEAPLPAPAPDIPQPLGELPPDAGQNRVLGRKERVMKGAAGTPEVPRVGTGRRGTARKTKT